MTDLLARIIHAVTARSYTPIKAKALFKRLNLAEDQYPEFRRLVRELVRTGRLALGRNQTLRAADAHGSVTGVYRRAQAGHGFVRVHRGFVVNLRRAVEVRPRLNGTAVLVMADGAEVPIARRQVGELRRKLGA